MRRISAGVTVVVAALAVLVLSVSISSQQRRSGDITIETIGGRDAAAGEVLIKFREPQRAPLEQLESIADAAELHAVGRSGVYRIVSRARSAAALLASLSRRPDVAFAEPNYIVRALSEPPNDPFFPNLWGLLNVGQNVNGRPAGTPGADIRAVEAWTMTVGSASNVVAVIDTGVDYTHGDLGANMWSAPAAFTVTIGGVAITCQAGTHGYNAIARTCDPMDDHDHGTHVAGTIGAAGNNVVGVTGVNWVTSMMALKFLNSEGSGTVADAIDAVEFAMQAKRVFAATGGANVRVLSNSWGGDEFSQALLDQINEAAAENMLFVAAAGNSGLPNDLIPTYPASYQAPNVVAVAATTNTDARAYFSNYGRTLVHLGAPGDNILSTIRGGGFSFKSGTSMAAPHVSGAAALALSHCVLDTAALKSVIVDSVDPIASMANTTISGGRLNARRALHSCSQAATAPASLTAIGGDAQVRLTWPEVQSATGYRVKRSSASGGPYMVVSPNVKTLQFTDTGLVNGTTYFYVISAVNVLGESPDSPEASGTPAAPADMVVTALTAPSAVAPGSSVTVSLTTKNQGAGFADPSSTRLYISSNTSLGSTDTLLAEYQAVAALNPGAAAVATFNVAIPSSLPPAAYYFVARADADDVMLEKSETNNTRARAFSSGPDLTLSTLTTPTVVAPGATIDAAFTVQNTGTNSAAPSALAIFWSTDTTFDSGDTSLARTDIGTLAPGGTQSGQLAFVVPANAGVGTYYVIGRADSANIVSEASESNNNARTTVRVGGDLVVAGFTAPIALGAGTPFVATETTRNSGSVEVAASVTHFYLSIDAILSTTDTLIGSRTVAALDAGEGSTTSTTISVPGGTAADSYYLFAKADGAGAIAETVENNNTAVRSVRIGPDLVVTVSSVTSLVADGSTATVSESVTNIGGGHAAASAVRYYLSKNYALDTTDILLSQTRTVDALAPDASSAGTTAVTIPAGTAAGLYYLLAQADGGSTVAESLENNNTHHRQFRVE
jgi:subtilisin family serine protease